MTKDTKLKLKWKNGIVTVICTQGSQGLILSKMDLKGIRSVSCFM